MVGGGGQEDDGRPAREKLAANLSGLMERGGLDVDDVARRAEVDADSVRLVLAGEDQDLDTTTVIVRAGAAGGTAAGLIAGISWVPYGLDNRPGGEWKIESID